MSRQLTVRIPDDLAQALEIRGRKTGQRHSELVRAACVEYLGVRPAEGRRPIDRVRHLIGSLSGDEPDLAERHREAVLESLLRGR